MDRVIVFSSSRDDDRLFSDAIPEVWADFGLEYTHFFSYSYDEIIGISGWEDTEKLHDLLFIWEPECAHQLQLLDKYNSALAELQLELKEAEWAGNRLIVLYHNSTYPECRAVQQDFVEQLASKEQQVIAAEYSHVIANPLYTFVADVLRGHEETEESSFIYHKAIGQLKDAVIGSPERYLNTLGLAADVFLEHAERLGADWLQTLLGSLSKEILRQWGDRFEHSELCSMKHVYLILNEVGSGNVPERSLITKAHQELFHRGASGQSILAANTQECRGSLPETIMVISGDAVEEQLICKCLKAMDVCDVHTVDITNGMSKEDLELLRSNKHIPVLLIGIKSEQLDAIMWAQLRNQKDVLNPIIVLGDGTYEGFCKEHPVFSVKDTRYHRLVSSPWSASNVRQALVTSKELFDDWTREYYFKEYGHPDLLNRLCLGLHKIKCLDSVKEIPLVDKLLQYSDQLEENNIRDYLCKIKLELQADNLESASDMVRYVRTQIVETRD